MDSLQSKVKSYVNGRAINKIEIFEKYVEKLKREASPDELTDVEERLSEERGLLSEKYQINNWLTDAANRAKQINLVTHAPKYTHSDTRSIGILCKKGEGIEQAESHLCSSSLQEMVIDVIGNAAAMDVAGLLQLSADGVSLLDEISTGCSETLKALAISDKQYQTWFDGFSEALESKNLNSGQLSKQLYYPVYDGYHLLCPLYASSLSQALYLRLTHAAYAEESKTARKARKTVCITLVLLFLFLIWLSRILGGLSLKIFPSLIQADMVGVFFSLVSLRSGNLNSSLL